MGDPVAVTVKGPDHTLRARALDELVTRLLGDDDPTLALAETNLPAGKRSDGDDGGAEVRRGALAAALDGARTPPFGTKRRVVVIRSDDSFSADEGALLASYLADPEPTSVLVLELVGRVPSALSKALKAAETEDVSVGTERDATGSVLTDHLQGTGLSLDAAATRLIAERLGEDAGRVPGLVDLLESTFGAGASLTVDDVAPYLGEEGGVPVFELTKAIDAGHQEEALAVLQRLTVATGMHPLQIMAVLHGHYRRILRLDDPAISSEDQAPDAVGGHPYPAKLAWRKARQLGTDGLRRAFDLLARADADLRGGSGAPASAVLEILVTRLTLLSRRAVRAR